MTPEEKDKKANELALKIFSMSGAVLLVNMRFLAKALSRLPARRGGDSISCSAAGINYSTKYVLDRCRCSERLIVHDHLHMIMHCLFRHWHIGYGVDAKLWDLSCDIAAESILLGLGSFFDNENEPKKRAVIDRLSRRVRPLTAEKLYAYFRSEELEQHTADEWAALFSTDDHSAWHRDDREYEDEEQFDGIALPMPADENGGERDSDDSGSGERENSAEDGGQSSQDNNSGSVDGEKSSLDKYLEEQQRADNEALEKMWEQLAKEVQSELENFDSGKGSESRHLVQQLQEVNRERYDYTSFLKRFAVRGEVMRSDPENFDLGYYSYGMGLYGNVALIEPLEYRETKLVKDLVIAVDTSGSVSGKTVQSFLRKTYSILKSTESFFTKVRIYVIQCDTEVREAVKLTNGAELEKYMKTMEIRGLGGTDFRPVFEYVDRIRASGELTGLKGLIYFTDGLGDFPEKKPPYDTAFVFLRSTLRDGETPEVPPWAIKLVLDDEDIEYHV